MLDDKQLNLEQLSLFDISKERRSYEYAQEGYASFSLNWRNLRKGFEVDSTALHRVDLALVRVQDDTSSAPSAEAAAKKTVKSAQKIMRLSHYP